MRSSLTRSRAVVSTVCLLACGALASCSGSQPEAGPSLPAYTPQATTTAQATEVAEPTPSASASLVPFTPEGLSDPGNSFTVTELPEGLSPEEQEVARAYIAYQHALWPALRETGGDRSGIEATTTGAELEYAHRFLDKNDAQGKRAGGLFYVKVLSVDVSSPLSATVGTCEDQRQMTFLDADGQDITTEGNKHAYRLVYTLERTGTTWKTSGHDVVDVDQC